MSFGGASIYAPPPPNPGVRVLIMRLWPRGVRKDRIDVWMKDAAPTRELLDGYHHAALPWADFQREYRRQILEERPHVLDELRSLEHEHGRVTLMCVERIPPDEHCHRLTLIALLEETLARP